MSSTIGKGKGKAVQVVKKDTDTARLNVYDYPKLTSADHMLGQFLVLKYHPDGAGEAEDEWYLAQVVDDLAEDTRYKYTAQLLRFSDGTQKTYDLETLHKLYQAKELHFLDLGFEKPPMQKELEKELKSEIGYVEKAIQ